MFLFSNDLGVDLGTSNVLIYADGKGLVVREPSVVAMDKNTGKILQVGAAARNMLGRTPGNVVAMHPLKDGTVSDHEMTVRMLQEMFKTATKASFFTPKPRVVISVPSGVSEVEERSVINAAIEAGARRAVSYTHLDVYKRQLQDGQLLPDFPGQPLVLSKLVQGLTVDATNLCHF